MKPFHKSSVVKDALSRLTKTTKNPDRIHVCFYDAPFGVVPIELDEVYPLSQHETALPLDKETTEYVAEQVSGYVTRMKYKQIVLVNDRQNWGKTVVTACRKACARKGLEFHFVEKQEKLGEALCVLLEAKKK